MRGLSVPELLQVWERGLAKAPVERALTLLLAANPDMPPDALATLSIGQRDANLLTLRERTFGPALSGVAVCPLCEQQVELTFDVASVRASSNPGLDAEATSALAITVADYELQVRPPNSADVVAIAAEPDAEAKRRLLFERCVLAAQHDGHPATVDELPDAALVAVAEHLALVDPQADVQLNIACPSCGHSWRAPFDIVGFFWSEIEAWAYRVLHEVHTLASAYGWHEQDILALSPARRQFYLEMAGA